MDDLLELIIRILDPLVQYIGPHAVAAVAVIGAVATYFNSRKQRRREKRLESKVDLILKAEGIEWSASNSNMSAYTAHRSSLSSQADILLVRYVKPFISQIRTLKERVKRMSNINWFGIISALLGAAKIILQSFGIDVITDDQINQIANGLAALMTVIGVIASNRKGEKKTDGGAPTTQHSIADTDRF